MPPQIRAAKNFSFSSFPKGSSIPSREYGLGACGRRGSEMSMNTTVHEIPKTEIITSRLIRELWVPRPKKPDLTAFVTEDRMERIKKNATIVTLEEKEAEIRKENEEKDKLREEANARKAKMQELEIARKQQAPVSDLEQEEIRKAEDICSKANEIRLENEEEIKEVKGLILNAKVQAIRDDQIVEKKIIKQQVKKAETELDEMMEKERVEGLKREEEAFEKRKQDALEGARLLKQQIQANFEHRIIEKDKKVREGEKLKKHFVQLLEEEIEEMKMRKEKQKQLRECLIRDNAELLRLKEIKKQESKQEDIAIAAYQRFKAEKEEAEEAALKEKKRQRELEIAKLRAQQERARDVQAEKDALRARRAQEEKERAYRQAEKEAAIKNKKTQEELCEHRTKQQENQNTLQLLKAQEEQKEFNILMERNKQQMEEEEVLRNRKRLMNLHHAKQIREQIQKKEQEKIEERREFFFEGTHRQQEEKIRKQRINARLKQKLKELDEYDIPKNYTAFVKRKMALKES